MLPYLIESAPSLSAADINRFEQALDVGFPQAFRDFYLATNGGYIDDALNGNDLLLAGFVPIKHGRVPMEQAYRELVEDVPALAGKCLLPLTKAAIISCYRWTVLITARSAYGSWTPSTTMRSPMTSQRFSTGSRGDSTSTAHKFSRAASQKRGAGSKPANVDPNAIILL